MFLSYYKEKALSRKKLPKGEERLFRERQQIKSVVIKQVIRFDHAELVVKRKDKHIVPAVSRIHLRLGAFFQQNICFFLGQFQAEAQHNQLVPVGILPVAVDNILGVAAAED